MHIATQDGATLQRHESDSTSTWRNAMRVDAIGRALGSTLMGVGVLAGLLGFAAPANAQYATGGSGQYRSQILWFEWGTAPNAIPQIGTTVTNNITVAGSPLAVTCSLTGISGNGPDPDLRIYRPGAYGYDGLDDLYNIGGTGGANTMDIGLVNRTGGTQATFTFACSATLGGLPYVLDGLVFADAETTDPGELIRTVPALGATLRVIERYRAAGCTDGYNVNLTGGAYEFTTSTTCDDAPSQMGIYFLDNAATATITLQGSSPNVGLQAVAVGVMLNVADYGDAPASYGSAGHLPQFSWSGGVLPSGNTDIFSAGFSPAALTQPVTAVLGTRVDAENAAWAGAGATLDDSNGVPDDEDGVNTAALAPLYRGLVGNSYSVPVTCVGTAPVAGWIDFDLNGTFDADERSATATCSGGGATLTWTVNADIASGQSYLRVRTATNVLQLASATGLAGTGEAEDYAITIADPRVQIAKITQGGTGGPFAFATTNTLSQPASLSTTVAGTAVTGTPVSIDDLGVSVVVTETIPSGWLLGAISCTDAGGTPVAGATYNLATGQATLPSSGLSATSLITCTYTNGRPGSITIVKDAVPNNAQDFAFTTTGAGLVDFSLDDDADATLSNTRTFSNLGIGSYSVTESAVAGWSLTNLVCTDPDNGSTVNVGARVATIDLDAGENITCTYTNTSSQPTFGTCDGRMWLAQQDPTQLYDITTATNPFTFQPIGGTSAYYNGAGYNPTDNYMYALRAPTSNELLRIGADGTVLSLGVVSGLPVGPYNAGTFTASGGILYIKPQSGSVLHAVNVSTLTSTSITLAPAIPTNTFDLASVGSLLYTVDAVGQLRSINPVTGATAIIGTPDFVVQFGALFGASNGLYGSSNTGGFYRIDPANGKFTLISGAPSSTVNDGANCPAAALSFASDLSVTKTNTPGINGNVDQATDTYTPGANVVYTIVVSNTGQFGAQNVTVSDPLPTGITTASWSCGSATGGAVCGAPSGTGAINDSVADLPAGSTLTYLYTTTVPAGFTGNLSNTVTVAPGPGNTDPNPGNNTATDVDQSAPLLTLRKISVGGVDSFGFTGTNGVVTQALVTAVAGTPVAGATQSLTAASMATTITESTTPATYQVTAIACTGLGAGGTATPDLANRTVTLNAAATAAGANIVCTFTNTLQQADLQVVKTASPNPVVSGDVVTYTLVVSNNGPTPATNVVLSDVPSAGQTCTTPSTTATCTASGGASCPSPTVPVSALLGSGISLPNLPVGGQVTVTLQCTVNASGQ